MSLPTPRPHTRGQIDILTELEPGVERRLDRHLATAREWFPHTYIPWSQARDFDGPLDGSPWRPADSPLPDAVRDALVVNLLTEDNLPSYHHEIHGQFGREGAWLSWLHRWTAEEARHADALRTYLHARRAVDPVRLERDRMHHVSAGYRSEHSDVPHALAYVMVQEMATRQAHRNTGRACGDPLGEQLMSRIAADENLHMLFYRDLCADGLDLAPDLFTQAVTDVICDFTMPGHGIPGFRTRAARIAVSGIYDLATHRDQVLRPLLHSLRLMERTGLGPRGEQALDRLGRHLEQLDAQAERFRQRSSAVRLPPRT
ncbi:acyl-ACP desaturase [Streptomyces alboniger]|uniref:Acyl-ACP desaturase n=1 Tax=Streptomyces alboniger TaxID=132473 RepID=A0A5J6H9M8_STRAD|nr:acyl-ACP desaturase [Streptomyces alboniger]QEV16759.1 acyl-ACP desaturase [Streptomyces alboniger]